MEKLVITKHAIEKYKDLTGCTNDEKARSGIIRMYEKSTEVEIDPRHKATRILRNKRGIKDCKYYEYREYRMVIVVDDPPVMVTFEKKLTK